MTSPSKFRFRKKINKAGTKMKHSQNENEVLPGQISMEEITLKGLPNKFTPEETEILHDYITYVLFFGKDIFEFCRRNDFKISQIQNLIERMENLVVRDFKFYDEIGEFYKTVLAEFDKTLQREVEMTPSDALGAVGRDTAIYHDTLLETMSTTVRLLDCVKKLRELQNLTYP